MMNDVLLVGVWTLLLSCGVSETTMNEVLLIGVGTLLLSCGVSVSFVVRNHGE